MSKAFPSTVTLRDSRDQDGARRLDARLQSDGTLLIEGQDIGPGVERFFGPGMTEYEWAWTIRPQSVTALKKALKSDDDVLSALKDRFSGAAAADLKPFLDDNGVAYEAWSRVGD